MIKSARYPEIAIWYSLKKTPTLTLNSIRYFESTTVLFIYLLGADCIREIGWPRWSKNELDPKMYFSLYEENM